MQTRACRPAVRKQCAPLPGISCSAKAPVRQSLIHMLALLGGACRHFQPETPSTPCLLHHGGQSTESIRSKHTCGPDPPDHSSTYASHGELLAKACAVDSN